jgi:hypothetical protein
MKYTITSGVNKIKDNLRARLNHNYRYELSHKNVENNNIDTYIDNGKIIHFTAEEKRATEIKQKKADRTKWSEYEEEALNQQFKLLQKSKAEGRLKHIERKSRLNPIMEGIVAFGNVYTITEDTEIIKEKTKAFNTYVKENETQIISNIFHNLNKFAKEFNTEISNIIFHYDEGGLVHCHYMIKNFDNKTGQSLDFKKNKNNIGYRLQDIICEGLGGLGFERGKRDSRKRKMTKQQLVEFEGLQKQNKKLRDFYELEKQKTEKQRIKKIKNYLKIREQRKISNEYHNQINQIRDNIQELIQMGAKKGDKFLNKLDWILTNSGSGKSILEGLKKLELDIEKINTKIKKKSGNHM